MSKLAQLTDRKVWLAPLAGFSDYIFRQICRECGADVVVSEMVSADGLLRNPRKTLKYAEFDDFQRPFGIQLFGSSPEIMSEAAGAILPLKPDFIDINMGCPVKKVVKRGAGSALLREPEQARAIIRAMRRRLSGSGILLSVKLRSGWDRRSVNLLEILPGLLAEGPDFVCIHPRTRSQMYSGKADWSLIKKAVEISDIPVIGNGDIRTEKDAKAMFDQTGCNSVMIGRGALGYPWIFTRTRQILEGVEPVEISSEIRLDIIKRHLAQAIERKGEVRGLLEMRAQLSYYTKGMSGGARTRRIINKSTNLLDVNRALEKLFSD